MNRRKFFELAGKAAAGIAFLFVGHNPHDEVILTPEYALEAIKSLKATMAEGLDNPGGYVVPVDLQVDIIRRPVIGDIDDMEALIRSDYRKAMDADIDRQFLTGEGIGKPLGILNNTSFPGQKPFVPLGSKAL